MVRDTLGGCGSINAFVNAKIKKLEGSDKTFESLFGLMFSERENVMYEQSRGYRIEKTTYGQVYDSAIRLCPSLSSALSGCARGSVVGIYMQNGLPFIKILWALLRCGYVPLLMNMRLDGKRLEDALSSCGAAAVVSDGRTFSVPTIDPASLAESDAPFQPSFADGLFVMSSGTTGGVKLCCYKGAQFSALIRGSAGIIRSCRQVKKHYNGSLKLLTFLPFYHIFGLVAVYIWFAFFSRTFVHLPDMSPDTIVNTVKRHGVTHIFAVPLFWETVFDTASRTIRARGEKTAAKFEKGMKIADALAFCPPLQRLFSRAAFREVREGIFGESIRFMITGGSRIGSDVMRFFNNIGYRLADGYGMSEIGITSVELSSDPRVLNSCSIGLPMSCVRYSLSERGTLLVSGECMAEYIIENGVRIPMPETFDTLDLCEYKNGRYRIVGRCDDLIVSSTGENINPGPIEESLRVPGVRGVCLTSVPSERGELPVLVASVEPYLSGEAVLAAEARLRKKAAELGVSSEIKRILITRQPLLQGDEFKLNRKRIKADVISGALRDARDAEEDRGELDATGLFIRECFAAVRGVQEEDVSPSADFFTDLGGSSLEYFAVLSRLSAEFGVPFPEDAGSGLSTVKALSAYISSKTNQ